MWGVRQGRRMTAIKTDKAAGKRFMARQAGIAIVCLAFAALFWYSSGSFLAVGLIGFALVLAFVFHERSFAASYRCPECGGETEAPDRFWSGARTVNPHFYCSACNIDWDLGFPGSAHSD